MLYHITALAADDRTVESLRNHLMRRGIGSQRIRVDAGGRGRGDDPEILVTVETERHDLVEGIKDALAIGGGTAVACIEESSTHDAVRDLS